MSHIPAKAMPHAKPHDADSDSFAPSPKRKRIAKDRSDGTTAAWAIGGVLAIGAITAFALPALLRDKPQPKKSKAKRRKDA